MKDVVCDRLGDPSVLKIQDVPVPEIGPSDVLIKVGAASVNFPDVLMLTADYQHKPELPFIPGMEGAGTISAVGAEVRNWRTGDRVIFGVRPGAFAEYVKVPASGNLMRLPAGWSDAEGSDFAKDYAVELPRLAELGVMRPHISHRFPMERAADAFRVLIDRKVVGKAVIE